MSKARPPRLVPGSGKSNAMLEMWSKLPKFLRSGIVYVATKSEVESLDAARFLATFGAQVGMQELRRLRARVHFTTEGYDDREEELYEIPEVRAFYANLHGLHPCWIYMARAECPCLHAVALSIVPNVTVCRSSQSLRVFARRADFRGFLRQSAETAYRLDRMAEICRKISAKVFIRAACYFGLPT